MSASTGCDAALWLCGSEKGRTMSAAVYRFYVGIDWATEKHRVVVLDAERRVVREREVCHEGAALESFADWLTQLAASAVETVAVALEVPRGGCRCPPRPRPPRLFPQSQAALPLPRSLHARRRPRRSARRSGLLVRPCHPPRAP